ncbi:hypothetical protein LCGC14_2320850, partial [marine sediment metagenome]
ETQLVGAAKKALEQINSLRADAVLTRPNGRVLILEAKRKLDMAGLGQLLTYRYFYCRKFRVPYRDIDLAIVYEEDKEELHGIYSQEDIELFKV